MKAIKMLLVVVILQNCVLIPSFESKPEDRLFLKEIITPSIKLEWYFYSTISNFTPDYIAILNENETDTICIASNVADLTLNSNKIMIGFYGHPRKYGRRIEIPQSAMGYEVVIDTSYALKSLVSRKTYKKSK